MMKGHIVQNNSVTSLCVFNSIYSGAQWFSGTEPRQYELQSGLQPTAGFG